MSALACLERVSSWRNSCCCFGMNSRSCVLGLAVLMAARPLCF
ncbi:hypothetical protein AAHH84_00185 [Candidatus Hodgkinia cicadicola]